MDVEVEVEVPVRVCDVGGWTDTWFAGHGRVCSLAAGPGVGVTARARPGSGQVTFELTDYDTTVSLAAVPPEHRLLAAAVGEAGEVAGVDVDLCIRSAVPPGCSLGTSAAVCVGVVAALDALRDAHRPPEALAEAAHRAEAGRGGRQSGVQDQVAAVHGGANLIEIPAYPRTIRTRIDVPPAMAGALVDRLVTVAYGAPHDSSAVHDKVIAALRADGPDAPGLDRLRAMAGKAAAALRAGDIRRYGAILTAATDAQADLHPALLSPAAHEIIDLARSQSAAGWKVNGAGGGGGSVSVLTADRAGADRLAEAGRRLGHRPLDLHPALDGVRVVQR